MILKDRMMSLVAAGCVLLSGAPAFGDAGHDAPLTARATTTGRVDVSKETQFLLGIRTERVVRRVIADRVRVIGRFVPVAGGEAEVAPAMSGIFVGDAKHPIARIGKRVTVGEVLGVLEQLPADQFALDAAYHEARGELDQAEKEFERHSKLGEITSYKQLLEAETRAKIARAAFGRAKNEMSLYHDVKIGDRAVHRSYITSPIAGTVTESRGVVGQHISPERWLFRVVRLDTLWVEARLYEADLPKLGAMTSALVRSNAYPDLELEARLIGVSGEIDRDTRTAKAVFEVGNPGALIKSGMFADVWIDTGDSRQGTAVPVAAIVDAGGRSVAYIHTAPEVFERRTVVTGQRSGGYVEIVSGLSPGERIVTVGLHQLWSQDSR